MDDMKLGAIESRFANMIWEREPIPSGELVKLCADELNWKKSTTYTVLRKLCDRGIFQNQDGTVTSLISRQDFYARQSEQIINETFDGSLPAFVAAFTTRQKLSDNDIAELQRLIDQHRR
ncbi:MAG: BlaI/MecI/CopY family transcriptional regulator [Lachnospiraceae bacterium]|nr:BlaI/MecI/CopY family transcriptional regulator [Lachnospiraceae bacterium]